MSSVKHERRIIAALRELGCTNIMSVPARGHTKFRFCLPNSETRVITCSSSPKDADTALYETQRLVKNMIKGVK
jgi:hypothetical protein